MEKEKLPLDAVAFHDFGRDYALADKWILPHVQDCLAELDKRPYFKDKSIEIHVGECSFFPAPKNGDAADTTEAAAHLPGFFKLLLEEKRLTLVQWAQLFDTGADNEWGNLGMIDLETRKQKPVYNVYLMYALMPVGSVHSEAAGEAACLASMDDTRVAVMLYNTAAAETACKLTLNNLPFAAGAILHSYTFAVDARHSSFWETPGTGQIEITAMTETKVPAAAEGAQPSLALDLPLPGPGVRPHHPLHHTPEARPRHHERG
ncbi:MAG: hypothetical protein ABIF71_15660 [Planctomycetota bacterium]